MIKNKIKNKNKCLRSVMSLSNYASSKRTLLNDFCSKVNIGLPITDKGVPPLLYL